MRNKIPYWILGGFLLIIGLFFFVPAFIPYAPLKNILDGLSSDGNFNSMKPGNAGVFKGLFIACGMALLSLAALTLLHGWKTVAKIFKQFGADFRRSISALKPHKNQLGSWATLLIIMALAVILRFEHLYRPFLHDEAYTFVAFGRSFFAALTDYHLPNNHVFHSILVFFSTRIFGPAPWAVRLPAFTAGVLLVPAVYWLGKRLYDRWTGLAAAFLVAWFPALITYSNNARGYTLVALFTVLILALGDIVRKEKNLLAWALISLFSALGLFTVPVMAFPFGILFLWLFLENFFGKPAASIASSHDYRSQREFLYCWIGAGFGAAFLTILFYLPIMVYSGPQRLFGNDFVARLPWADLLETLSHRFAETWSEWTFRVSPVFILLLAAGWVLALVFHRRISSSRIPLQLAAVLWIAALLLIQRPNAWSKVWVFLQPLMLLWAAAGIFGLLNKLRLRTAGNLPIALPFLAILLLVGVIQVVRLVPDLPALWAIKGQEEKTAIFLQDQLQPTDLIVVAPTADAPVWYYSILHGIPDSHFDRSRNDFESVYLVVNLAENQTLASVIAERGPTERSLDLDQAQLLETFGTLQVYSLAR